MQEIIHLLTSFDHTQLLLLTMHPPAQLSLLEDAMEELRKFEGELKVKSSLLSSLRIDVSSAESLSKLKGRCSAR